ncbi:MAG: tetratricopeptide repeat protein [Mariniphaga sp.]|nr:tetratricopeptide repeat protein [Mariniphaga sp.]
MGKKSGLSEIELLFKNGNFKEAEYLINSFQGVTNIDYWLLKGKIHQKMQKWGIAINSFNKALELDPDNKEAKVNIEIINDILNFWNPEMFNA